MNQNYIITNLLGLKDENLKIIDYSEEENIRKVCVEKEITEHYCPLCHSRMHSKGITRRNIKHQIFQDGYRLELTLLQRRCKCTNDSCNYCENDSFSFIGKHKQTPTLIQFQICKEMKNPNNTAVDIGKMFGMSSVTVTNYFMQFVDCKRLPLPKILCVDEVFLNIDSNHKYALVLMDFETGNIVDIVISRRKEDTQRYFSNIPLKERKTVKFLICDMYNPYINYTKNYFYNSVAIVDYFHVISWLNRSINNYINQVKKRLQKRDEQLIKQRNIIIDNPPDSKEVYLLKNYKFFLLKNTDSIKYYDEMKYNSKLSGYVNTHILEELFFKIDKRFMRIRNLKNIYSDFNSRNTGKDKDEIKCELEEIIDIYIKSKDSIFTEFASLLINYKQEIINSFFCIEKEIDGKIKLRRLSNGPIESFNRLPKDLKRTARGFKNFDYIRNRILWIVRDNQPMLAVPKTLDEIHPKKDK